MEYFLYVCLTKAPTPKTFLLIPRVDERQVQPRTREKPHPGIGRAEQGGVAVSQRKPEESASAAPVGDGSVVFGPPRFGVGEGGGFPMI